jgi:hypothetical protein
MRNEKTHLDIGRGGALDETVNLHDVAVDAGARPLDAYSPRGSGVSDCALDENGIGFARGCGRSGQPGGERGLVWVLVQVVGPLCVWIALRWSSWTGLEAKKRACAEESQGCAFYFIFQWTALEDANRMVRT